MPTRVGLNRVATLRNTIRGVRSFPQHRLNQRCSSRRYFWMNPFLWFCLTRGIGTTYSGKSLCSPISETWERYNIKTILQYSLDSTVSPSLSLCLARSFSHSVAYSLIHSHPSLSVSLTHTSSLSHTNTNTHTHTLFLSPPLSYTHSVTQPGGDHTGGQGKQPYNQTACGPRPGSPDD